VFLFLITGISSSNTTATWRTLNYVVNLLLEDLLPQIKKQLDSRIFSLNSYTTTSYEDQIVIHLQTEQNPIPLPNFDVSKCAAWSAGVNRGALYERKLSKPNALNRFFTVRT
jgi:hypothetical protein